MQSTSANSETIGIVVVDHGSRRAASNELLLDVVQLFRQTTGREIVEAAHMELAEPSIAAAFARCVDQGATLVVVHPYFLSPGRHWSEDIPRLAAEAAANHPGVRHLVTAPLGLHTKMAEIMAERVEVCLARCRGEAATCGICDEQTRCQLLD
ncbi:CbiX/SirB N-terminal domain-containing protein [Blastopirellula retiformator]|uniref:Sirohydrochlorin cobaltochelatase n=1 Tax=Blastopirellula retiformator TaxID=2527970 RepID=A0A5C5V3J5_9BACT|nr:CbiX/SirB N-terminal domain-containing protein [Blastopirellula retiformator]TWT32590.1 Sirohydrochlorin cobaltochelatase [Blastopirellula retiformator]